MNPEVATIGGFDDGLIEVGVCDDPIEPAVEDFLVGVGFTIAPFGVRSLGNLGKCPKPGSQRFLSSR